MREYGSLRRGGFQILAIRMMAQMDEIRGFDVVFYRLRSQLNDICCSRPPACDPVWLCKFACYTGAVRQMRQLAVAFRDMCVVPRKGNVYLNDLIMRLDAAVMFECSIYLAVAMSLHARLGDHSPLAVLGGDIIPLCVPRLIYDPVGRWQMVMNG